MEQAKVDRINALARLSKTRALTDAEKQEQAALRAEYIRDFRAQFGQVLDNTVVQYPDGSRTSLNELKEKKKN